MKKLIYPVVFVLIAAVLLGFASCTSGTKATGTALALRYETEAKQQKGSDNVSLTVSLYLDYNKINVGTRSTNTLTVNGETQNFKTEAISSQEKGSVLLTEYTVVVRRQTGKTVNCPVSVSWQFGGTMDGEELTWLTQSGTITLNDDNVTVTDAPLTDTTAETGKPVTPMTDPETNPVTPPATEPVTEPVTDPVTEPDTGSEVTPPGPDVLGEPFLNTFEGALMSWSMKSDSGTKLNLYAECGAYDAGNGKLKISVALYLTHSSLSVSERGAGTLTIGGEKFDFRVPQIKTEDNAEQYTWLVTAEAEVDPSQAYKIEAVTPMGVVYSGISIETLRISGTFTSQEIT